MEFLDLNLLPQAFSGVDVGEVPVRSAANNGAATRGWRRQGRKKPIGVREEGVEDLDTAIREGPHARYLMKHGHKVLRMRDALQKPPPGLLTWKDLRWNIEAERETKSAVDDLHGLPDHGPGEGKQSKLIAYIPWDRVMDFVNGEQSGRKDVETTFVRDKFDPTNVGDKTHYRWNCHIELQR